MVLRSLQIKVKSINSIPSNAWSNFFRRRKDGKEKFSLVLFTPFDQPDKLVDAATSHVLHSKKLPSPMGMYLSAFETESTAGSSRANTAGKFTTGKL